MVICYSGNRKQIHRASAVNKPQSGQAANTLHFLHRQPSLSQWGLELFGLTLWVFFGLLDPWLHFLMEGSVALPFVPTGGLHPQYTPVSSFIYSFFEEGFIELYANCIPDSI